MTATELLAFGVVLIWPVIPLFWIPVHGFPRISKKIGKFSYAVAFLLWAPVAYCVFSQRFVISTNVVPVNSVVRAIGLALFAAGGALQLWTGKLLSLRGLMGMPELSRTEKGRVVASGAFALVRHPTYLSHTLMFLGVFLLSGNIAAGMVTVLDFVLVYFVIIPLEERELEGRFGFEYREYKSRVPRFFPSLRRSRRSFD